MKGYIMLRNVTSGYVRLRKKITLFNLRQPHVTSRNRSPGFTLLELLIVISIIAILAATMIPNFIGFDSEARLAATKTNLNTLRTRVSLFRTKEGKYPEELNELLETTYSDMGVERPYLDKFPAEFISSKKGNREIEEMDSDDVMNGEGGWAYYKKKARVMVNWDAELGSKWGDAAEEIPSEW